MVGSNKILNTISLQNSALINIPNRILSKANSDFIALCKAQINILTQGLSAAWAGVYLTETLHSNEQKEIKLLPAFVYPQENQDISLISNAKNQFSLLLSEKSTINQNTAANHPIEKKINLKNQIVMPLLYEEIFMGLLVIGRNKGEWNDLELAQIEQITTTIAIARSLEIRQNWYQQQLQDTENIRTIEDNKIHDLLHQLRNPLTALRTFTKLLLKRILPEDKNKKIVEGILRESDRLEELLQHFEQKSSINSQLLELNASEVVNSNFLLPSQSEIQEKVNLIGILEPLVESAMTVAEEKNIILAYQSPANPIFVQGNIQAIREVLSNLIDNAIKYTPNGGQIIIELETKPEYQEIIIADNGYGIPLENQQFIFQRHYRGIQKEGEIPGTGLGLAIAKELIEKMNGQIKVTSPNQLGQGKTGTTFIVMLCKS